MHGTKQEGKERAREADITIREAVVTEAVSRSRRYSCCHPGSCGFVGESEVRIAYPYRGIVMAGVTDINAGTGIYTRHELHATHSQGNDGFSERCTLQLKGSVKRSRFRYGLTN